ncbi:hypothetical protein BC941DRAFT_457557 [Chlamydoabsidia padenii]|nr:hypothetical protein BC941DRAFT_457557 [Chlamydoabsidia padenii]
MLYDQAKKDIFYGPSSPSTHHKLQSHSQHSYGNHSNKADQDANGPVHTPSVTTIVLLQVQVSMIQVIARLKKQKKGITTVVRAPIRWGLFLGLMVVDNVARALQVDQEMAYLQQSDEQTNSDGNAATEEDDAGSLASMEDLSVGGAYPPLPQRSQSATTANTKYNHYSSSHLPGLSASVSSSIPSSPLMAIHPPMVSQSSEGLRVRPRKISLPTVMTNERPILSNVQQRRLITDLGDGQQVSQDPPKSLKSSNKASPTVRRVNAQRDLASTSSPATQNGLRRQTSQHDLNAPAKTTKRSQHQRRTHSATAASSAQQK